MLPPSSGWSFGILTHTTWRHNPVETSICIFTAVKTSKLAYANRWHDRSLTLSSLNTQQIQVESFKFFQVSYIFRNVKVVKCILLIYTIHDIPGAFDLHMLSTDSCEWMGGGGGEWEFIVLSLSNTLTPAWVSCNRILCRKLQSLKNSWTVWTSVRTRSVHTFEKYYRASCDDFLRFPALFKNVQHITATYLSAVRRMLKKVSTAKFSSLISCK
jgi:hypothetical protein